MSRQVIKSARLALQASRISYRTASFRACPARPIAVAFSDTQSLSFRYASSDASPASPTNPSIARADELMQKAGAALEDGDVESARKLYEESLAISEGPNAWFNLGVCEYHLKNTAEAIRAWGKSLEHSPSADAHTNLASAYILSKPPQPALAIKHLTSALELSPSDPEIAFNLAAVLESTGSLDHALRLYKRAEDGGIERAKQNIRSVAAKISVQNGGEPAAEPSS